jgi:uncharacterized protein
MELFLCVVGMVLVVEGLPYFAIPDKMKAMMRVVLEQDDITLRIFGAALLMTGLLILFVARKGFGTP